MEMQITGQGEGATAELVGEGVLLAGPQDMLDLIATAYYEYGCCRLLLKKEALPEAFFDLSSGMAGEMLQKVINYGALLAIVGDFSGYGSRALRDFIHESNQGSRIYFVPSRGEAMERLRPKAD